MARDRGDQGDEKRRRDADRQRQISAGSREIGTIPNIANVRRRSRCRKSLKLFCETYNPAAFRLGWSRDHLKAIARIEEAATLGALFALAMARGSGKTTICRMAALWVISYAIRRYAFLIGSTDEKGRESLDTLKVLIRFLPEYAADFPEISVGARHVGGIAQRGGGQTCGGESTLIEWQADRVTLPTVPPPDNWPKSWPLRSDGKVPTSGVMVAVSGLTGEGIRGSLKTLTTGAMVRPDFVLLDDPQTHGSATSRAQNATRLQLVSADVLGMAGPDESIAAVMPCTVIARGDMADEILDRTKNPLWRGERSGILTAMPKNMAAWDAYFEVYARCAQLDPPDFTEANELYVARRAELDEGTEATWPDRKKDTEVSAVQSAMHLYFRDRAAFMAEYMNAPVVDKVAVSAVDADAIAKKFTNLPRGVVPRECTRVTAFIDVGGHVHWYLVTAWDERFGGAVIDYGPYPDQGRDFFTSEDARPTLQTLAGYEDVPQDVAIYGGLTAVAAKVLGAVYRQEETGQEMRVERCAVDANWGPATDVVYDFCRRSVYAGLLLPSHGKYIGARSNPMHTWPVRPGERAGSGWRMAPATTARGLHLTIDVNYWKSFAAARLRTGEGGAGCVRLFRPEPGRTHTMLADHFTAEYPQEIKNESGGRIVDEWQDRPNRDNHLWDCFVGSCVAASVAGLKWSAPAAAGEPPRPPPAKPKRSWSEIAAEKAARRAAGG